MSLSNIVRLKTHLSGSDDALLQQLLDEVEAGVKMFLRGRRLDSHEIVNEYHDGSGRPTLILKQRPVTAVTEVRVDANGQSGQSATGFGSGTVWTQGDGWFARSLKEDESNPGELIAGGGWPEGIGNIRVTYTAGYSTVPADVQMAVHMLVARIRADHDKGRPVASETLGSYSYSLLTGKDEGSEMASARAVLMKYRSIAI